MESLANPPPYHVYILECIDGRLYVGITDNLSRRLNEHFSSRGGHFTRTCKPIALRWVEAHPDRFSAARRERQLKGWTRRKKWALINGDLDLLKRL